MTTPADAFCPDSVVLAPTGSGMLDGLRFAAKDVFDVAGHVTGFGSPDWQRTHAAALQTASVIELLRAQGAVMQGKTVTDELTYSLNGENWHYGTPPNPRASGRIPGGSSSGSASAVAADLVDVALGTDCGGSIRIPASFCGLYGLRPTHGRVAVNGLLPLAPSFDTVGWFASSADHLRRVGSVLLGPDQNEQAVRHVLIARDFFSQLGQAESGALEPALKCLADGFSDITWVDLADGEADALLHAFRILQAAQIWAMHGEWITRVQPNFGPGIRERFMAASKVLPSDVVLAQALRERLRERIVRLLPPDTVLCLPTAPGIAPLLGTQLAAMEQFRNQAMRMLCIAGLAGAPQVSLPVALVDGCPLGLSLMMAPGSDRALLDVVATHDLRDPIARSGDTNRPEVVTEVRAAFARYEHALVHNEVAVLDHLFCDSAHTVRYGAAENLLGFEQIRAFRAGRPAVGLIRALANTVITTFGRDAASACTEFSRDGSLKIGRQTQTWIRTPAGWKVVAAHVSLIDPA